MRIYLLYIRDIIRVKLSKRETREKQERKLEN